jgi:hypothetical protein
MRGEPITVGGHLRIRPFNTADSYPEQRLDNDLCQAVVAGHTVYLRGQVPQDLDTGESVDIGDPAAQAEQVMTNVETLLAEAGASISPTSATASRCTACSDGGSRVSIRCSPAWSYPRSPGRNGWSR